MKTFTCQYCGAKFESPKVNWIEVVDNVLFMILCAYCMGKLDEVELNWDKHIGRFING